MTCEEFRSRLENTSSETPAIDMLPLEQHLESCPHCQGDGRRYDAELRALLPDPRNVLPRLSGEAVDRVLAALRPIATGAARPFSDALQDPSPSSTTPPRPQPGVSWSAVMELFALQPPADLQPAGVSLGEDEKPTTMHGWTWQASEDDLAITKKLAPWWNGTISIIPDERDRLTGRMARLLFQAGRSPSSTADPGRRIRIIYSNDGAAGVAVLSARVDRAWGSLELPLGAVPTSMRIAIS